MDAPLLPASTSTVTTELLGLCSSGIRDEEGTVVGNKLLLELHRAVSVDVLSVVRNNSLRDSLADGIDLRRVATTLDTDADVDGTEGVLASYEDGLIDLEAENLRLEEVDGRTIDMDEAAALLGVRDRSSSLAG